MVLPYAMDTRFGLGMVDGQKGHFRKDDLGRKLEVQSGGGRTERQETQPTTGVVLKLIEQNGPSLQRSFPVDPDVSQAGGNQGFELRSNVLMVVKDNDLFPRMRPDPGPQVCLDKRYLLLRRRTTQGQHRHIGQPITSGGAQGLDRRPMFSEIVGCLRMAHDDRQCISPSIT